MTEKIDQAWTEQMKLRVDERIDDETRAAILEGLAQADRGEYVPTRSSPRRINATVYEASLDAAPLAMVNRLLTCPLLW